MVLLGYRLRRVQSKPQEKKCGDANDDRFARELAELHIKRGL